MDYVARQFRRNYSLSQDAAALATLGEDKAKHLCYGLPMSEARKHALLLAATILAARKVAQYDKPCPAVEATISDAITMAEKILCKIEAKYPTPGA